jgi:dethiobiotin synthetase
VSAVFITGSGTGVGKTFVARGLITHYRALGRPVDALKPLASGFDPAAPSDSDPAMLLEALGRSVTANELQKLSPWRFRAPLSPDMAARAEGRSLDFEAVADYCRDAIAKAPSTLLIEGIGGIMVPLDQRHTVLDLMVALGEPVVLVGGSYLGTLSHLLSAQDVLLRRALDLRAVVVSESEGMPPPLRETLETLGNFIVAPLIALPRHDPEARNREAFQRLAELSA